MRRLIPFLLLAAFTAPGRADIPGHNPELDGNCNPGFQWSRKIAACGQAHCPPGASRTHVLACNCGEAWNKPFRTCIEGGLVTHCVPKGQSCGNVEAGFDPLTGGCKASFLPGADGRCEKVFPERLRCRFEDLAGQPLAGLAVTLGEKKTNKATEKFTQTHRDQTGSDGTVEIQVADRRSGEIVVRARPAGEDPFGMSLLKRDFDGTCIVIRATGPAAEAAIEDAYADLLRRACVDDKLVTAMRGTKLDTVKPSSPPKYVPKDGTVYAGSLDGEWSELEKTLLHEYGHAISNTVIDPGYGFVFDYPVFDGKYVGGAHDPWKPTGDKEPLMGPNLYGEQIAFEEGLADFIALVSWIDQKRDGAFDPDMLDDARAMNALAQHGKNNAARIEGVVTRVLYELYEDELRAGKTAEVLGDLIATITYPDRHDWTSEPARTLAELFAAKVRRDRDAEEAGSACHVPLDNLGDVAGHYGISGDGVPKAKPIPRADRSPADLDRSLDGAADLLGLEGGPGLAFGRAYSYDVDDLDLEVSVPDPALLRDGTVPRVRFEAGTPARFTIESAQRIRIDEGRAVVRDMSTVVPGGVLEHLGTAYTVAVDGDGAATVAVGQGEVRISPAADGAAAETLAEGQGAVIDPSGTVRPLEDPERVLEETARAASPVDSTGSSDGEGGKGSSVLVLAAAGGVLALVLLVAVLLSRRTRRA